MLSLVHEIYFRRDIGELDKDLKCTQYRNTLIHKLKDDGKNLLGNTKNTIYKGNNLKTSMGNSIYTLALANRII